MRCLALAVAAAIGLAPCVLLAQQPQANPAGSASEQRRMDRERGDTPSQSDWEREQAGRDFKEAEVPLPAYPKRDALIEFQISNPGSFRYFVDPAAISIGKDEVVRYTLVVRSGTGIENVSYDGVRCAVGAYKVFAYGNDGKWSATRQDWRDTAPRWQHELRTRYLCPMKQRVRDVAEAVDALRRGGHPTLVNVSSGK